ncbi:MAG TPA: polyprenol phosphomannose-dependent alpha 1,6 mannosyltransferase MptB [Mycobacteriales bacterium]|nr:polyprenol phosphomannose-dependent alpha 1,6 mannosyltransferase MptB [Mycobacteriales bacterium]
MSGYPVRVSAAWQRARTGPAARRPGGPVTADAARHRALGVLGALLLAGCGMIAGAYPEHPKDFLVSQVVGITQLATIGAYGGLVLLVVAWIRLGRLVGVPGGPDRHDLLVTLAQWAAPLLVVPPLFSKDVYSYAAQGAMTLFHVNPYQHGPQDLASPLANNVDQMWQATPAPYGPVFLVLAGRVIAVTGEHTWPAVLGLRLLAVLGVLLMAVYVPRLARRLGVDPRSALWLGVLNPLVLIHLVGGAHNDALLIGLLVAGLALVLDGLPALGVALVALALLVKAPAGLALAFCVPLWADQLRGRLRQLRAALLVGATAIGTVAVTSTACGLGYGWVAALQTPGQVRNWLSVTTTMGQLTGLLGSWFGAGDHMDGAIAAWRGAGGLAAVVVCAVLLVRARRIGPVPAIGMGLVAVVALGPVVQPWYLLWGFVILAAASADTGVRSLVAGGSAAMALLLMPRGGPLEPRDIVEAICVGALVLAAAVLAEWLIASRARAAAVGTAGPDP